MAYNNMATDNGLYNTIISIHTGCYPKKLLDLRPGLYIPMQKAAILHT